MELPGVPPELLGSLAASAEGMRLALVGGAVRDLLLHRVHNDPWLGLPDLDLVVESDGNPGSAALRLVRRLVEAGDGRVIRWQEHGAYGTVELALRVEATDGDQGATILLDVATARREQYPVAGENPVVCFGSLDDDLGRRDFSINAMALLLAESSGELLDPHGGLDDLRARRLRFLHPASVRDDPTRLLRGARYAARLGLSLAAESRDQAQRTLAAWPWPWHSGDAPAQAPAALGTRLRMELELLLEREPWPLALALLQEWGGLVLLDPALQEDRFWRRRLRWAERLGLPLVVALLVGAGDPLALAERLQLPHRHHRLLVGFSELRERLRQLGPGAGVSPARWSALLEGQAVPAEAVALALAAGVGPRRPLLRWWLRWRHLRAPTTARELMAQGMPAGPALGKRLRELRADLLDHERV